MARLHELDPSLRGSLPHLPLGAGPTPVRPLPSMGPGPAELWLKDEGAFGDGGWGGNKVRKLEWLIPDAKRRRRRTLLTFGGLGTNWGLATALYGRAHGLEVALGLVDQPIDDHVRDQLDRLEASGAALHLTRSKLRTVLGLPWLLARHASGGRPPYLLPAGGSSPLGTLGYVEVALEIAAQVESGELAEPSHAVIPVGSGGTAAGLLLGFGLAGLSTRVVGVVVNDQLRLDRRGITGLARRSLRLLARRAASAGGAEKAWRRELDGDGLVLSRDWMGTGYGHPTGAGAAAREAASDRAGLDLDPVYTAKAMAAVLAMNAKGELGRGPVLFLDTNGPR